MPMNFHSSARTNCPVLHGLAIVVHTRRACLPEENSPPDHFGSTSAIASEKLISTAL
jgi:hypothetical protein